MELDLRKGICETDQYKAWKFPGGEIHFKFKNVLEPYEINIKTRLNTSDDIMFLFIVVDTIKKDFKGSKINLFIPYIPYQQADRNFGEGECFSLKTMTNLINSMELDEITVYDPHSEVSAALLNNCKVVDNSWFINTILSYHLDRDNIIIIAPDSGAYKKIYKLCEKIHFKGDIVTCSKSRNHETGEITTIVPTFDENKPVLIIDDICLAGNTFFNIRKKIPNENVYLAISHGVFNDNVDKLGNYFNTVFTTNSRRDESVGENIEVIKIF